MDSPGTRVNERLLCLVGSRTGVSRVAIVDAFLRSESFLSLCSDLQVCERAYRDWSAEETAEARSRASEYALLLAGLEEEVLTALGIRPPSPRTEELETTDTGDEHAST